MVPHRQSGWAGAKTSDFDQLLFELGRGLRRLLLSSQNRMHGVGVSFPKLPCQALPAATEGRAIMLALRFVPVGDGSGFEIDGVSVNSASLEPPEPPSFSLACIRLRSWNPEKRYRFLAMGRM